MSAPTEAGAEAPAAAADAAPVSGAPEAGLQQPAHHGAAQPAPAARDAARDALAAEAVAAEPAADDGVRDADQQQDQEHAGETVSPYTEADLQYTWLQCENPACGKWRRVRCSDQQVGKFTCAATKHPRFNSCSAPQELPDVEVDWLLEDEAMKRHVLNSQRPPVEQCTEAEFEADLIAFLQCKGDDQLATFVKDKRITCNNTPLDLFGLYREVIKRGGLLDNERYDERGRWNGGINFAGDIFVHMKNFTVNNRATSVGNQLLNNYKKFLLAYERAWRSVDMPQAPPIVPNKRTVRHRMEGVAAATAKTRTKQQQQQQHHHLHHHHQQQQQQQGQLSSGQQKAAGPGSTSYKVDPLALLADVAHGEVDEASSPSKPGSPRVSYVPGAAGSYSGGAQPDAAAAAAGSLSAPHQQQQQQQQPQQQQQQQRSSRKRRRTDGTGEEVEWPLCWGRTSTSGDHPTPPAAAPPAAVAGGRLSDPAPAAGWAAAANRSQPAAAVASGASIAGLPAGLVVLVHDPDHRARSWGAVVADLRDLPLEVLQGGVLPRGCSFPSAVMGGRLQEPVVPVLLLGSQQLGWVSLTNCNPLTEAAVQAAAAAAWTTVNSGLLNSAAGSSSGAPEGDPQLLACIRSLKLALQCEIAASSSSSHYSSGSASSSAATGAVGASAAVAAVAVRAVAERLLQLEGLVAPEVLGPQHCSWWCQWRSNVEQATSAQQLGAQVLLFAHQLSPGSFKPGVVQQLWNTLCPLLGLQGTGHGSSSQQQQPVGIWDAALSALLVRDAPSCCSVTAAVAMVEHYIDWARVRRNWARLPSSQAAAPYLASEEGDAVLVPRKARSNRSSKRPESPSPSSSQLPSGSDAAGLGAGPARSTPEAALASSTAAAGGFGPGIAGRVPEGIGSLLARQIVGAGPFGWPAAMRGHPEADAALGHPALLPQLHAAGAEGAGQHIPGPANFPEHAGHAWPTGVAASTAGFFGPGSAPGIRRMSDSGLLALKRDQNPPKINSAAGVLAGLGVASRGVPAAPGVGLPSTWDMNPAATAGRAELQQLAMMGWPAAGVPGLPPWPGRIATGPAPAPSGVSLPPLQPRPPAGRVQGVPGLGLAGWPQEGPGGGSQPNTPLGHFAAAGGALSSTSGPYGPADQAAAGAAGSRSAAAAPIELLTPTLPAVRVGLQEPALASIRTGMADVAGEGVFTPRVAGTVTPRGAASSSTTPRAAAAAAAAAIAAGHFGSSGGFSRALDSLPIAAAAARGGGGVGGPVSGPVYRMSAPAQGLPARGQPVDHPGSGLMDPSVSAASAAATAAAAAGVAIGVLPTWAGRDAPVAQGNPVISPLGMPTFIGAQSVLPLTGMSYGRPAAPGKPPPGSAVGGVFEYPAAAAQLPHGGARAPYYGGAGVENPAGYMPALGGAPAGAGTGPGQFAVHPGRPSFARGPLPLFSTSSPASLGPTVDAADAVPHRDQLQARVGSEAPSAAVNLIFKAEPPGSAGAGSRGLSPAPGEQLPGYGGRTPLQAAAQGSGPSGLPALHRLASPGGQGGAEQQQQQQQQQQPPAGH